MPFEYVFNYDLTPILKQWFRIGTIIKYVLDVQKCYE